MDEDTEDFHHNSMKEEMLGAHAMKRVAAGAHLPTPWLFELAKRPDDRADYCLEYLQYWNKNWNIGNNA